MKNKHQFKWILLGAVGLSVVTVLATSDISSQLKMAGMMQYDDSTTTSQFRGETMIGAPMNGAADEGVDMMIEPAMEPAVEPMMGGADQKMIMPPYYGGGDALDVEDRVYQQDAYFQVIVNNVSQYSQTMKAYFESINGRILNSNLNNTQGYKVASLVVKVPVDEFDAATMKVVEGVDEVYSESVSSLDITSRKVSVEDRITTLEDQLSLKQVELLEAQTELEKRRVELDIQRLERQLASAREQLENVDETIEYATVIVTAADSERYYDPRAELSLSEETRLAWQNVEVIGKILIRSAVKLVVYAVLWVPVLLLGKWGYGKVKNRKNQ